MYIMELKVEKRPKRAWTDKRKDKKDIMIMSKKNRISR